MNLNKLFSILLFAILTFNAYTQTVKINEIMYNFGYNLDELEAGNWIELYNTSNTAVDLSGWQIKFGDSTYVVTNYNLAPNQYVVASSKDSLMRANYPGIPLLNGSVPGGLDDNSEQIQVLNAAGMVMDEITYADRGVWPECADGKAQSLSLNNTNANNNDPANWVCSGVMGGSPGMPNVIGLCDAAAPKILINEIHYKQDTIQSDSGDWIELYNASGAPVDISNWILYDTDTSYKLPNNKVLNPASYYVIPSSLAKFIASYPFAPTDTYDPVALSYISLSGDGETITLADDNNCKVHRMKYNDSAPWPESPDGDGPSLSLISESYNNKVAGSWAPSTAGNSPYGTPGEPNNIPDPCNGNSTSDLVINEINYNSSSNENPGNWIELYNKGTTAIQLDGYKINNEGEQYVIPPGNSISPGGYFVVADSAAQFNYVMECPNAAFLNKDAKLNFSNNGELISIYNLKTQDYGCLVDSVKYNDKLPWPVEADGGGYTLALKNANLDNSDPNNWEASGFTLGSPGLSNQSGPIVCGCDHISKDYSGNHVFDGFEVINAQKDITISGGNIFFRPACNTKIYAVECIELMPRTTNPITISATSTVLLDIKPCQ